MTNADYEQAVTKWKKIAADFDNESVVNFTCNAASEVRIYHAAIERDDVFEREGRWEMLHQQLSDAIIREKVGREELLRRLA